MAMQAHVEVPEQPSEAPPPPPDAGLPSSYVSLGFIQARLTDLTSAVERKGSARK